MFAKKSTPLSILSALLKQHLVLIFLVVGLLGFINSYKQASAAQYQFIPTSQNLVTGTDSSVTSATAAAAGGTNIGSWKATLADDNFQWTVTGTGAGVDAQLNIDGVDLNGANKIEIQTEVDLDAAVALKVQICDWVSSTSVDSAADGQCSTGGWRSINTQNASNADTGLTTITTPVSLRWHIYDGYFTTGSTGGTAISTPLSNFISSDGNKRIKIRYYSTTASAVIDVDYLRANVFIDSIYQPAGVTNLTVGGGAMAGTYVNASAVGNSTTAQIAGGDDVRITVPGTVSNPADFYFSYNNIKTYTGMNTIVVRAEYSCSVSDAAKDIRPKIYNFNSTAWENLTTAAIDCSTTDAADVWAKNNVTLSNYISNGEMRVGWYRLQNSTDTIRIDYQYIMLGVTNTDSSKCEIPIGTGTATDCTNTRDIDTEVSSTGVNMSITAEDESTNMGSGESNSYYPFDIDNDATASEEGAAAHIAFSVTVPSNAQVVGDLYAVNFAGRSAGTTAVVSVGMKDYSGYNTSATGSWLAVGTTSSASTMTYTDPITAMSATVYGQQINPEDYVHTGLNEMRLRLRTSTDGASTDNNVVKWDFAFVGLQWIDTSTFTIQGSCKQVDRTTNCSNGSTVKYALNGVVQPTTTTSSSGTFTLTTNAPSNNSIVTVYIDGAADSSEAVAVTKYDGTGTISSMSLFEKHLSIGSGDNASISNADLSTGWVNDEDVFYSVASSNLTLDEGTNNSGQSLYISSGNTYAPGGTVTLAGSWVNAGTFTHGSSRVILDGTTTGYTITAGGSSFYSLLLAGSGGEWTLQDNMTVTNILSVSSGTLNAGSNTITLSGSGAQPGLDSWCSDNTGITCTTSWLTRKKITLNNSASTENLTNFPVLIQLSSSNIDYSKTQNSGQDIRFVDPSDNTTVLDHEIETWNESGTSYVWVRVPQIDLGSVTDYIWMYYDNAAASDGQNATGVWDSNSKAVWHMKETPTANLADSTSNINSATTTTLVSGDQITGKIGGAINFSSSGKYAYVADANSLDFSTAMTIDFWQNSTNVGNNNQMMGKWYDPGFTQYSWYVFGQNTDELAIQVDTNGDPFTQECIAVTSTANLSSNTWNHIVITLNSTGIIFYVNGAAVTSSTVTGNCSSLTIKSGTAPVNLGGVENGQATTVQKNDEVRLSNSARSAEWIEAEYLFENDNSKYSFGLAETQGSVPFSVGSGTFNSGTSTVNFTSGSATTIPANTYYNLGIKPGANSTTHTVESGTLTVGGTLTLGNGTNTGATIQFNTYDPVVTITGGLTINNNTTLEASSSADLTIGGNFTNSGVFTHNNGTVVFNTTTTSNITGATTFYNFTSTTGGKILQFGNGSTFVFTNTMTVTGESGNPISIQSDSAGNQWLVTFSTSQSSISWVNLKDSGCSSSQSVNSTQQTIFGQGNNGTCWNLILRGGGTSNNAVDGGSGGSGSSSGGGGAGGGGGADGGSGGSGSSSGGGGAGGGGGDASP